MAEITEVGPEIRTIAEFLYVSNGTTSVAEWPPLQPPPLQPFYRRLGAVWGFVQAQLTCDFAAVPQELVPAFLALLGEVDMLRKAHGLLRLYPWQLMASGLQALLFRRAGDEVAALECARKCVAAAVSDELAKYCCQCVLVVSKLVPFLLEVAGKRVSSACTTPSATGFVSNSCSSAEGPGQYEGDAAVDEDDSCYNEPDALQMADALLPAQPAAEAQARQALRGAAQLVRSAAAPCREDMEAEGVSAKDVSSSAAAGADGGIGAAAGTGAGTGSSSVRGPQMGGTCPKLQGFGSLIGSCPVVSTSGSGAASGSCDGGSSLMQAAAAAAAVVSGAPIPGVNRLHSLSTEEGMDEAAASNPVGSRPGSASAHRHTGVEHLRSSPLASTGLHVAGAAGAAGSSTLPMPATLRVPPSLAVGDILQGAQDFTGFAMANMAAAMGTSPSNLMAGWAAGGNPRHGTSAGVPTIPAAVAVPPAAAALPTVSATGGAPNSQEGRNSSSSSSRQVAEASLRALLLDAASTRAAALAGPTERQKAAAEAGAAAEVVRLSAALMPRRPPAASAALAAQGLPGATAALSRPSSSPMAGAGAATTGSGGVPIASAASAATAMASFSPTVSAVPAASAASGAASAGAPESALHGLCPTSDCGGKSASQLPVNFGSALPLGQRVLPAITSLVMDTGSVISAVATPASAPAPAGAVCGGHGDSGAGASNLSTSLPAVVPPLPNRSSGATPVAHHSPLQAHGQHQHQHHGRMGLGAASGSLSAGVFPGLAAVPSFASTGSNGMGMGISVDVARDAFPLPLPLPLPAAVPQAAPASSAAATAAAGDDSASLNGSVTSLGMRIDSARPTDALALPAPASAPAARQAQAPGQTQEHGHAQTVLDRRSLAGLFPEFAVDARAVSRY